MFNFSRFFLKYLDIELLKKNKRYELGKKRNGEEKGRKGYKSIDVYCKFFSLLF